VWYWRLLDSVIPAPSRSFAFEIGFVWLCIGFILGLFWHFIGFNWVRLGSFWVRFSHVDQVSFLYNPLLCNHLRSFDFFGNWVRFAKKG